MEDKEQRERDFQVYLGWKVPIVIKLAWLSLVLWISFYLVTFFLPELKNWMDR